MRASLSWAAPHLSDANKKRKDEFLYITSVLLREALSALDAAADSCPPMKALTGVLIHIVSALEVSHFLSLRINIQHAY